MYPFCLLIQPKRLQALLLLVLGLCIEFYELPSASRDFSLQVNVKKLFLSYPMIRTRTEQLWYLRICAKGKVKLYNIRANFS